MLLIILQLTFAFAYANLVEWVWHRYIQHGLGKNKKSIFSSHWCEHHKNVRKSSGFDLDYLEKSGTTEEVAQLTIGALLHIPLFFYFPIVAGAIWIHTLAYFLIHRKSHLDVEWAKRWVPWHYDHHMGKNQDANWCVTFPLWDHILRTRVHFLKNQKEVKS